MIYQDDFIFIEREESEIPWIKIFTKTPFVELSDCDERTRSRLFEALLIAEKTMIEFYKPKKINIASFANYVPRVHLHVMARFQTDSFFPEPMWGKKQREGKLDLPSFSEFCEILTRKLKNE
ncbi:HIT family protein [Campylobacter sp. CCUG 57310]|uniref:HIT family protein n=1 Tax=Campylobacter sp. CCUG 57310 TaxID=2517362 RepID=UPI00156347EB|nr:HIT family protein [Campylobacter sp. CCUG 57310]QKF91849.1 histidine triad nucleotide-binding protein [Campylobacter sp. CCUG 57310]